VIDDIQAGPLRNLGDGLTLRSARHGDGDELGDFNGAMHADVGLPASTLAAWTHDLFESPHPTFRAERDVTVVEDTATGRIVSALFLIPQVWSYAGVPVTVGQPELIATHPDYRRRGLVRARFEVVTNGAGRPGICGSSSAGSHGTTASSATPMPSICRPVPCCGSARRHRHRRRSSRCGRRRRPTSASWLPSRPTQRAAQCWVRCAARMGLHWSWPADPTASSPVRSS